MTCAGALALCAAVLVLVKREQRSDARTSLDSTVARAPSNAARPGAARPPAAKPAPRGGAPTPEAPFVATPLFDPGARLEPGKEALLRFRAHDDRAGVPVVHEDLAVTVVHLPERTETRLPVREVEPGVYQAELTPDGPGRYLVTLTSTGLPVRTTSPVSLGVVGAVGAVGAGSELEAQEAQALARHRRTPGRPGGGLRAPRGG